jgi:hypothetical protein
MSDDLDTPIYGAKIIAVILNLVDENGEPDERKAYHALASGYIDADKFGRVWTTTRRRALNRHLKKNTAVSERAAESSV